MENPEPKVLGKVNLSEPSVKDLHSTVMNINGKNKQVVLIEQETDRELALVDYQVLKRLASYLPKSSFYNIKDEFRRSISATNSIAEYVKVLEEELAFHRSVNIITTISASEHEQLQA